MNIRYIITLVMLTVAVEGYSQQFAPEDYVYPLEGVSRLYSANFGELRSDHFHSGIDIKTEGVVGKRVVAVADGYISRIALSPYGYGLALYVTHPNGSTSVYAHLSRFKDDVAEWVERERYRTKRHSVNLFCNSTTFPVKQGELIAYSGNSGSSAGPHLHFEIRESATQKPINPIAMGIVTVRDNIAPLMMKLHYIETDTVQGIVRSATPRSFDLKRGSDGYTIAGGGRISIGRSGYFVLETSDRREGVTNTFGLYRVTAALDSTPFFEYVMDSFTYDNTRYCNAIGYYPFMVGSRNEVIRLSATENSDMSHYTKLVDGGVVSAKAGESHTLLIEVFDDCGNSSKCNIQLVGKADEACFSADEVDENLIVRAKQQFKYSGDGVSVSLPAMALYESVPFVCELSEPKDSLALSNSYKILNTLTPLHKPMSISIAADVPFELQSKVGLVCVGRSGRPAFIGGDYLYGRVTASSRNAGEFYVVADTLPPTLKLGIAEGSQQAGSSYFTCVIADDLSGVNSYTATLNGEWIALDMVSGRLRHNFREKPNGQTHTLKVEAVDGVGNSSSVSCTFVR